MFAPSRFLYLLISGAELPPTVVVGAMLTVTLELRRTIWLLDSRPLDADWLLELWLLFTDWSAPKPNA
jgi:hypothetical protein